MLKTLPLLLQQNTSNFDRVILPSAWYQGSIMRTCLSIAIYGYYVNVMYFTRKFFTADLFIPIKVVGLLHISIVLIRIASTKATVEYQKEVIRLLRENLRRSQQAQDTSSKWKMVLFADRFHFTSPYTYTFWWLLLYMWQSRINLG